MSNKTANLGIRKPLFGTDPILAAALDQLDAAIPGFATKSLHDTQLANLAADGSGGTQLIPGVAGKIILPTDVMARWTYGGVAVFAGTAFGDLSINPSIGVGGYPETILVSSSKAVLDQTAQRWIRFSSYGASVLTAFDSGAGGDLFLCLNAPDLTGGDVAGNTNELKFYIRYLLFDIATGLYS
jgi:hypothetical protein